jgi:hypothetical protein
LPAVFGDGSAASISSSAHGVLLPLDEMPIFTGALTALLNCLLKGG